MPSFRNVISRTVMAACLLASTPSVAEQAGPSHSALRPGISPGHVSRSQTQLLQFPTCHVQFQVVEKTPTLFHCKRDMSNSYALNIYVQIAKDTVCAPTSYWTVGPEVTVQNLGGTDRRIHVRCRHTG